MKPDPQNVKAIQEMKTPRRKQDLQTLLGMVTYMGAFIPRLSEQSAVLRALLETDTDFQWLDAHDRASKRIKMLISAML